MPDSNRPRRERRPAALRAMISALIAAIIVLVLSAMLPSPACPECAAEALPAMRATATAAMPPAAAVPDGEPAATSTASPTRVALDLEVLQQQMLDLINADRAAAGVAPVSWDETAALAAQAHAVDMARHGYLSHRDREGHRPFYRYTQLGGLDAVQENVYLLSQQYDDGSAAPVDDWAAVVRSAEAHFMDSEGHRGNILAPTHTHAGIGIAHNPDTGDVRIDQLFVDDYVDLEPLPLKLRAGDEVRIAGVLRRGATRPLLNLAYEPFPEVMTVGELNEMVPTNPHAETYEASRLAAEDGHFERTVRLGREDGPGLYQVRVWVDTEHGRVLASYVAVEVRAAPSRAVAHPGPRPRFRQVGRR